MCERFVALATRHRVLSVLEPVVRARTDASDRRGGARARRHAPVALQVPGAAAGRRRRALCREITDVLPVPWVVLSQGVPPDEFPLAVEDACRGGASGFLAGRALWTNDARRRTTRPSCLRTRSVPRLEQLIEIVDTLRVNVRGVIEGFYGTPWTHEERLDLIRFCGALTSPGTRRAVDERRLDAEPHNGRSAGYSRRNRS